MLVTSIFSFTHNVFKKLFLWGHENQELFGKGLTMIDSMVFNAAAFNSLSVISQSPVHPSCFPGVLFTSTPPNTFSKPLAASHITTVETMDSGERGVDPVPMTIIIDPRKEYWPSRDQTSDLLFSSPQCYQLSYGDQPKG